MVDEIVLLPVCVWEGEWGWGGYFLPNAIQCSFWSSIKH